MHNWMIRDLSTEGARVEDFIIADLSEEPERTRHLNDLLAQYLGGQNISGTISARRVALRVLKSLLARDFTEKEWMQYLRHSLEENWGDAAEVAHNLPPSKRNEALEGLLSDFLKRGSDKRALATAKLLGRQPILAELETIIDNAISSGWLSAGDVPTEAIEAMPEPQATKALTKIYEVLSKGEDPHGVRYDILKKLERRHPELKFAQPPNYWDLIPIDLNFTE